MITTDENDVRERWVCLLLILTILLVYGQVRHCEFINFDDPRYVTENSHVLGGLHEENIRWAFVSNETTGWQPLTWLSHMLDCELYGLEPSGHHLTNLLFHIATTVVLLRVLRRITGALWPSALVASLFALHPLHVESVAWVAERKDVLSAFFWMLTLWAYVRYAERPDLSRYLLALLLFACGLMAKPMLVTLPFVLLLLDFWPLRRVSLVRPGSAPETESSPSRSLAAVPVLQAVGEKLPFLCLSAVSSMVTFAAKYLGGAVVPLGILSLRFRLVNALLAYVRYIGKMIWPVDLAVYYPLASRWYTWQVAGAVLLLLGISALAFREARRRPYLTVGWFWYLGTLAPVLGLVQVGGQSMADRFTYIPLIGLFIALAWTLEDLARRWQFSQRVMTSGSVALVAGCVFCTSVDLRYWRDSVTLFQHALRVTHNNSLAAFNLACALSAQGRIDQAIAEYLEALRIEPAYTKAQYNLEAELVERTREVDAARAQPDETQVRTELSDANYALGVILLGQGKIPAVVSHFNEALRLSSDPAAARRRIQAALARTSATKPPPK